MKRIFTICCMILAGFAAAAQVTFDAEAGLNVAQYGTNNRNIFDVNPYHARASVSVGARAAYEIAAVPGLYANAGVFLSGLGSNIKISDGADKTHLNPWYIEIPVHAGYRYDFGEAAIFAEAGPSFDIGLFGNLKMKDGGTVVKYPAFKRYEVEGVKFDNMLRRFDIGADIRIGADFLDHYVFSIGYCWGLRNIAYDMDYDGGRNGKLWNRCLTISAGYRF